MELPGYDKDHYELDNCEEIHKEYPEGVFIESTVKISCVDPLKDAGLW